MMQITEDTPPDMLAGAMDLTVHLPNGKTVKMSVERSTPMMDLLVQITTLNHLLLSSHTLQVLGMAPSTQYTDRILPFKPNTPIGTLDTQHIKVLPKGKQLSAPKQIAPGHQPFESTFRLKVHLPRNQLYVTRVSRNVLLQDIMKKVCEEKNLDPLKYDFKHPANLDEVLDPKLTLSDYQITEIYVVAKGTTGPNQAFAAPDIMVLRKEEERKQMHNKTGGGVFNLIFKRGKSSMGSGSVSSDNRSISPTQSDDSRSVTPPAIQGPAIVAPLKKDPPVDKPKPPQRKRRPAPKPPQPNDATSSGLEPSSGVAKGAGTNATSEGKKPMENRLTICHSRNSSDSSGYHEASLLSEHGANTSLPRSRPKSAFVGDLTPIQSSSNLSKMSTQSRSTTSLITGRKKKAAPPPPPTIPSTSSPQSSVVAQSDQPSPLVASQSDISTRLDIPEVVEKTENFTTNIAPIPKPRKRVSKIVPHSKSNEDNEQDSINNVNNQNNIDNILTQENIEEVILSNDEEVVLRNHEEEVILRNHEEQDLNRDTKDDVISHGRLNFQINRFSEPVFSSTKDDFSMEEILTSLEAVKPFIMNTESSNIAKEPPPYAAIAKLQKSITNDILNSEEFLNESKPPEIVGVIPKTPKDEKKKYVSNKDSFGKKRCFQIASSLEQKYDPETASLNSKRSFESNSNSETMLDEISDLDENMFEGSLSKKSTKKRPEVFNQLFGIHNYSSTAINASPTSLRSSFESTLGWENASMKKWGNLEDLDSISVNSYGIRNRWVNGDASDTETVASSNLTSMQTTLDSISADKVEASEKLQQEEKSLESTDSGITQDVHVEREKDTDQASGFRTPPPPPIFDDVVENETDIHPPPIPLSNLSETNDQKSLDKSLESEKELAEIYWQYQLPSPPKAFRDSSPVNTTEETSSLSDYKDSVVTSPELFEKLKPLEDKDTIKSEEASIVSEEPLNTLTLEHLEKRKSLVYNRELATSLKMTDNLETSDRGTSSHGDFQTAAFQESGKPKKPTRTSQHHTLPNFKITTYDVPKHQNITVFEDDTIRSNMHGSRSNLVQSTENISFGKRHSVDEHPEKDYIFYKPLVTGSTSVSRSESFTTDHWSPSKPVSRSRSTLTLNKYQPTKNDDTNISRSNSLFDVSGGLQSLEVMKLIRTKLSTPTSSSENVQQSQQGVSIKLQPTVVTKSEETVPVVATTVTETLSTSTPLQSPQEPVKHYYYRGPPAVNMSTWSERPKIPVAVKEDEDYKLGIGRNSVSSKLIVNTTHNNVTSNNIAAQSEAKINENASEQITQKSGNVIIKIGGVGENRNLLGPVAYRKPFSNINGAGQRPHSIALDGNFDMNRVPVVKAVELKKSYKESQKINTSITHLNQSNDDYTAYDKTDSFKITENVKNMENHARTDSGKTIFRVGSFKPPDNTPVPIVRGFKSNNDVNNRLSWNLSSTLRPNSKVESDFGTNQHVPFSQSVLRRTESSKRYMADQISNEPIPVKATTNHSYNSLPPNINKKQGFTPAPPPMPQASLKKVVVSDRNHNKNEDLRDLLMESIRNFGGKKGLRTVKV